MEYSSGKRNRALVGAHGCRVPARGQRPADVRYYYVLCALIEVCVGRVGAPPGKSFTRKTPNEVPPLFVPLVHLRPWTREGLCPGSSRETQTMRLILAPRPGSLPLTPLSPPTPHPAPCHPGDRRHSLVRSVLGTPNKTRVRVLAKASSSFSVAPSEPHEALGSSSCLLIRLLLRQASKSGQVGQGNWNT